MQIGITTRSFHGMSNAQAAGMMAANGFSSTELCLVQSDSGYWVYNGMGEISDLTAGRVCEIADIYRSAGVSVHALGVFSNLIEEDEGKRSEILAYFDRHISFAKDAGIPAVATECGFIPGNRGVRADAYETAFGRLVDSLKKLCDVCERYGVDLALEPCVLDVVPSAKRMRDLIAQVGSPRLKVLLDPANLIANSSEDDMFFYLKDHISYIHGKDRKVNDTYGRLVGDGDIDWPRFIALYRRYAPERPFILEYAKAEESRAIFERCQAYARQASDVRF